MKLHEVAAYRRVISVGLIVLAAAAFPQQAPRFIFPRPCRTHTAISALVPNPRPSARARPVTVLLDFFGLSYPLAVNSNAEPRGAQILCLRSGASMCAWAADAPAGIWCAWCAPARQRP